MASSLFPSISPATILNGSGQITASGSDLALYLGANSFYSRGYTGTRASVATIDGTIAWLGHQSINTTRLIPRAGGSNWLIAAHPTGVTSVVAGKGNRTLDRGIAYGAKSYAGAVGVIFQGNLFGASNSSVSETYRIAVQGFNPETQQGIATLPIGTPQVKADVINSSWGNTGTYPGSGPQTWSMDALARSSGAVFVSAAGNSGPSSQTVAGPPAAQLNGIAVASLHSSTPAEVLPSYDTVSTFSGRSPTNIELPGTGTFTRAAVSISAPGESFSVPAYNGTSTPPNYYFFGVNGTSYASPTVAGAATLLVDVGYDKFVSPTNRTPIDGKTIKAVLLNSADKLLGWDNGQTTSPAGVITTTQALDLSTGTGKLNMARAFSQYTAGTTGNIHPLPTAPAQVENIGWNYESVAPDNASDAYVLSSPLIAGEFLTVTLTWFSENTYLAQTQTSTFDALANLSLEVYQLTDTGLSPIALSNTYANTVEHLNFQVPNNGIYELHVNFTGMDLGSARPTPYALAWSTYIPEPTSLLLLSLPIPLLTRRRT